MVDLRGAKSTRSVVPVPNWRRQSRLQTIVQLFRAQAEHAGARRAYVFLKNGETEDDALDCSGLDLAARAIAAHLQSVCRVGDRAILMFNPGLDFIRAFLGCLYAGVIAVPAYPPNMQRPKRDMGRLASIVRSCSAATIVTHRGAGNEWRSDPDLMPAIRSLHVVTTDDISPNEARQWNEYDARANDLALLQYTSGSTAEPKGVMVSHGNLLHNLAFIDSCEQNDASSVSVSWLPPYHDMGLVEGILLPAFAGVPGYLMAPSAFIQKPLRWLRAISTYRATNSGGPNFGYQMCVDRIDLTRVLDAGDDPLAAPLDLSTWRVAYNGSETVRYKTLSDFSAKFSCCGFRASALRPVYGLAESTLLVSASPAHLPWCVHGNDPQMKRATGDDVGSADAVPCGVANPDSELVIADPDSLVACEDGVEGEIWVSGGSVAHGYWENPSATRQVFSAYLRDSGRGPYLRTGDLGFVRRGHLFVTGRIKEILIVRGRKFYPQELEYLTESSMAAVPAGGAVAISVDDGASEELVMLVEIRNREVNRLASIIDVERRSRQQALARLTEDVVELLTGYFDISPAAVVLLAGGSLCKTSSGKPIRYACRAKYLQGAFSALATWAKPGYSPRIPSRNA